MKQLRGKILEPYKEEIFDMYLNKNMNATEISKIYNVYKGTVGRFLKDRGIQMKEMSHIKQKYTIDEKVFEQINTNEKAYWLGLLYADGCNTPKKNEVKISLQEKDGYILKDLKNFFNYNGPLFYIDHSIKHPTWQNQWMLQITNKRLSHDLKQLGMGYKKTFTLNFPDWLDKTLYPHFIRGYFDGDGNIFTAKNGSNSHFSMSGTVMFLSKVQEILMDKFRFSKTVFQPVRTEHPLVKVLRYGGNHQVIAFRDWIYKDATLYLTRKKDKFDSIITQRVAKNKYLRN